MEQVSEVRPYREWSGDELKEECRARELKVSGTVPELVARLEADDQAAADREAAEMQAAVDAAAAPGDKVVVDNADGSTTTTTDGHSSTTVDADGNLVSGDDEPEPDDPKELTRAQKIKRGVCVVDDGTAHTGRAVNGVICSAHAMRYTSDGNPR